MRSQFSHHPQELLPTSHPGRGPLAEKLALGGLGAWHHQVTVWPKQLSSQAVGQELRDPLQGGRKGKRDKLNKEGNLHRVHPPSASSALQSPQASALGMTSPTLLGFREDEEKKKRKESNPKALELCKIRLCHDPDSGPHSGLSLSFQKHLAASLWLPEPYRTSPTSPLSYLPPVLPQGSASAVQAYSKCHGLIPTPGPWHCLSLNPACSPQISTGLSPA